MHPIAFYCSIFGLLYLVIGILSYKEYLKARKELTKETLWLAKWAKEVLNVMRNGAIIILIGGISWLLLAASVQFGWLKKLISLSIQ